MRHRKKLIVATMLLAAAYATYCFWPHSNPEAVRALEAMRGLTSIDQSAEVPPATDAAPRDNVLIELRVEFAAINMTDATTGLFAAPGRKSDTAVVGRLKSVRQFLEIGQATSSFRIDSTSVADISSGQRAGWAQGAEVEIAAAPIGGIAAPPLVSDPHFGTNLTYGARLTQAGTIDVEVEFKQTRTGRKRTVTTDDGSEEVPVLHTLEAKGRLELKPGETLVIGGLSQKRSERSINKLPVLSELPGIGSWFTFRRECEIEEELVILVTPRIVRSVASK